jgi:AraC-like DNA-binding protein
LLTESELSVKEIAAAVGYSSSATFIRAFRRVHGITPASYRGG